MTRTVACRREYIGAAWNPFIRSITGHIAKGERLAVSVQPAGGKAMNFRPTILLAARNTELRWPPFSRARPLRWRALLQDNRDWGRPNALYARREFQRPIGRCAQGKSRRRNEGGFHGNEHCAQGASRGFGSHRCRESGEARGLEQSLSASAGTGSMETIQCDLDRSPARRDAPEREDRSAPRNLSSSDR